MAAHETAALREARARPPRLFYRATRRTPARARPARRSRRFRTRPAFARPGLAAQAPCSPCQGPPALPRTQSQLRRARTACAGADDQRGGAASGAGSHRCDGEPPRPPHSPDPVSTQSLASQPNPRPAAPPQAWHLEREAAAAATASEAASDERKQRLAAVELAHEAQARARGVRFRPQAPGPGFSPLGFTGLC